MKGLIVVPAFNESKLIYKVLRSLPKKLKGLSSVDILVINDGSTDSTESEIKRAGVSTINHIINRGLGAAIKTGIEYAKKGKFDVMVTFDGDGQHDPKDIPRIIEPIIKSNADLVIGSRFKSKQKIPLDRLVINWFANIATFIFYGVLSTDSQSGLRAFSQKALETIDFKSDRMEFSSEILLESKKNGLKMKEVPITSIYTMYSRAKGQKNTNAIPVLIKFLVKLLR